MKIRGGKKRNSDDRGKEGKCGYVRIASVKNLKCGCINKKFKNIE